ncbi:ATP-binding cassette domain-containing protein [Thermoactinomyces sp. CICC 10522]|uniref:ABC transporter ATP-binding protein n=1 Tax=Thermoactinomyces sp. CICC 10522 TaxID=2767427 RepID=UPI0018DB80E0|nr:ATP-binding cassette domain-containing protein [Thermoactinomyces sp. CICC 10522]MBH8605808.1 ATP-binding cassette domain-containing protein [Thermoactinomyces sp. CICC 10522]
MTKAIRVEGLSKSFIVKHKKPGLLQSIKNLFHPSLSEQIAVHPLDFQVEQGEILAFLGPNGAGKSTTIKMLTGILHPTRGSAEVLGFNPWLERQKLAFHIGSVFGQKSQLWYHLPPFDTFELMSRIYELPRGDYRKRRDQLIERFDLGKILDIPVRKLSLGQRMRCEIAATLLHRPKIVFLDEPTIGLDVVVKQKIRDLIKEMNQEEGTTLFITSHDAGDIEQLCKRAIVINHGQIILDDTVSNLKRHFLKHKTIHLKLQEAPTHFHLSGVVLVKQKRTGLRLSVDTSQTSIEQVLSHIIQNHRLADVTIEDPSMEEIITHIYEKREGG